MKRNDVGKILWNHRRTGRAKRDLEETPQEREQVFTSLLPHFSTCFVISSLPTLLLYSSHLNSSISISTLLFLSPLT